MVRSGIWRAVRSQGFLSMPKDLPAAAKSGAGAINVPVSCGGVCVRPGDIVIGDVNGVCVLTQEEAEEVMERALKKIEKQKYTLAEMKRTGQVYTKLLKK